MFDGVVVVVQDEFLCCALSGVHCWIAADLLSVVVVAMVPCAGTVALLADVVSL